MKIIIDARESGTSTGRYIDKLVEYLHKLKPDFEVVILTKPARLDFIKKIAPTFKVVGSDFKEFSFAEQLSFARQLYKLRADLVHFNAPQQPVLYFGRSVTTVHDLTTARFNNPSKNWLIFKLKQLVYRFVVWWVAHKSKRLIAISSYTKNDLAHFARVKQGKISVTHEAADKITEPVEPIPKLAGKAFVMYVGRPTPHKNLERLVAAMEEVKKSHPEILLVLAGKTDKNYKKLEEFTDRKNLTSQVIFTGFVTEGELRWLYENALAYVFPSLSEGFGLPALEAMAHSLPVVSSNATALPEIYKDAAVYFDPLDSNDMAEKIIKVASDPALRKDLIQKGLRVSASYSWQHMAEQTLKIYKDALK